MAAIGNVSVGPQTRSAEIIAAAAQTVTVTDARGRKIEVRRPSNVTRRNARKAMSAESQAKPALMAEAMMAFLVVSIDGAIEPPPSFETAVEALQDRLGDEGLAAIADALDELMPAQRDPVADAKNS